MIDTIKNINIDSIDDIASLKQVLVVLLNFAEQSQKTIETLKKENQQLKDEINRLKGEQGKPTFKAKKEAKNISSQKYTHEKKQHKKTAKKKDIIIDKEIKCNVDKSILPADAKFKRYETRIQQDIVFERRNTKYIVEVWHSKSENKTYIAKAENYQGYFGNNLKAFVITMSHYSDMTRSKILGLLRGLGIEISDGSIENILSENKDKWTNENRDILKAGLKGSYTQTDTTGAKVAGELWHTHVLCSDNFMSFSTLRGKGRKHLLYALQGEPESGLQLVYNEITEKYLTHFNISKKHKKELARIYKNQNPLTELEFRKKTKQLMPDLASKPTLFNWVCDAFAFGYYHKQQDYKPVNILISDNAPEYKLIGNHQGLCWIHDARYYNKLTPIINYHRKLTEDFKNRYWKFYKTLLEFKQKPDKKRKKEIENDFDKLFNYQSGYFDLDKEIRRTRKNRDKLLTVLKYPQIPLHNNQSELAARLQVRKRDVCLHTMTRKGTQLQDAFMSIIHTCNLLGQNAYAYIRDRISDNNEFYLPNLVLQKINS